MHTNLGILTVVTVVGACDAVEVSTRAQEQLECEDYLCQNSPEVMHYGVYHAHLGGLPDPISGIALESYDGRALIYKYGTPYALYVDKGRISGYHPQAGWIASDHLAGAELRLLLNGQPLYTIHIERVREILSPIDPTVWIETYHMTWSDQENQHSPERNVCNAPPQDPPKIHEAAVLAGMWRDETLVYEGDMYNFDQMRVVGWDKNWFNFGCAGHTLAKMRLSGHTGLDRAKEDKTTGLKLLVADYCGRGRRFTEAGVALAWSGGWFDYRIQPVFLESRWNAEGATCLDLPRLHALPNGVNEYPDLLDEIATECAAAGHALPSCSNPWPYDLDGALRISASPEQQPNP